MCPGVWTRPFCHVWAQAAASSLGSVDRKYHPANSGKLLGKWKLLQHMWSLRYEWIKAVWHGLWASLLLLATICSCNTWRNINPWPFIFVVICASPPIYIITGAVILELSFYTPHVTLLSLLHECGHKAASSAWDFCEQQPILMCCSLLSQWRGRSFGNSCAGELQGGNNIFSVHEKQWCTPHWLAANIFLHVLNLLF